MKQISFFMVAMLAGFVASSQKLSADKVPAVVKNSFEKAFPGVKGNSWEREEGNYEVNFKTAGKEASCVIDPKGNVLERETAIPLAEFPATAREYIKKNYGSAKIKETAKIVKSTGETVFEAEVSGKDLLFDAKGNFIKSIKEKGEEKD